MVVVTRSALVGRSAAKTAMLETVGKSNALNRTGCIKYNAFGMKDGIGLKSATEKFIDNFVLAVLVPDYNVESGKYTHCGSSNKSIRELLDEAGLEKCSVKAIGCRKAKEEPPITMIHSMPFVNPNQEISCYYYQDYKVAAPNLDYARVMAFIRAAEYQSIGMFLQDIDVTMDFAGSFDKDEVIEHLIKNMDFRMEGDGNLAPRTILDNERFVGRNCLTYMEELGGVVTRQKVYNKFVQMLESQSVRSVIGCHWRDWVVQEGTRLAAARDVSTYRGLTRAEVTFYIDSSGYIPSERLIEDTLLRIVEYIPTGLVYSTPFSKTWEIYCNSFVHSLVCIDRQENMGLLIYSYNEITGKLSGQLINQYEEKWKWVLEKLTLNGNMPVDVIDINVLSHTLNSEKKKDQVVEITGSRYFKVNPDKSNDFKTRLVSHKGCFSWTPGTEERQTQLLVGAGFVDHINCHPHLARKAANRNSKAPADLDKVEDLVINFTNKCCYDAAESSQIRQQNIEDRILGEALRIDEIRKPLLLHLRDCEERLKEIQKCQTDASNSKKSHLKDLKQGTYPVLSAKKFGHKDYGPRYRLVLLDKDRPTSVWSNWDITNVLNGLLQTNFGKQCFDEVSGYLVLSGKPIGHLTVKGRMLNCHGFFTVFCDFAPSSTDEIPSASVIRTEAVNARNNLNEELEKSVLEDFVAIPTKPREELLPYKENPELVELPIGAIQEIEAIGWSESYGKDRLLVQINSIMYQAGQDLEQKVHEIVGKSYLKIAKVRVNTNTRRKYAICSIIQSGQWHKLVNYSKTPLLTTQDGSTCVIDVQTVEHKGQKRKLLLTDNGQVFKLKKSRFEETVKPGFV